MARRLAGRVIAIVGFLSIALALPTPAAAAGSWAATGSLPTALIDATLTNLPDGRVLLAGGEDSQNNVLTAAELYNPATGLWTSTGSMDTERRSHTATLLDDGTVLV